MTILHCTRAMLPDGWADDVALEVGADGAIASMTAGADPSGAERAAGIVVPGMPNLHSHAFQRAMAGLAERTSPDGDDFWGWRDTMYRFVAALAPDQVEAIAAQLYVEMLKAGYTGVAEFHYLHNGADGQPYAEPAEMSERIIAAARRAGIGLTLLPVLYQTADFEGTPAAPAQSRFVKSTDAYLDLLQHLADRGRRTAGVRMGIAPHSLRAVPPDALAEVLAARDTVAPGCPVHIHIAEQTKEIDDCVAWSGARPVDWLLDHAPVDGSWVCVHATHMSEDETDRLAASGAVAGLCPTTEANLGDGLFPLAGFLSAGGVFGIGSDSNVSVSPIEELRWLDYGQRLAHRKRSLVRLGETGSVGAGLWRAALGGGARALGTQSGRLEPGRPADLIVLDAGHPALAARSGDMLLDALVFAGSADAITDVMVGGRWVVRDRHHPDEEDIAAAFRDTVRALRDV